MLVSGSVDLVKITQIVVLEVAQAMGFAVQVLNLGPGLMSSDSLFVGWCHVQVF